MPTAAELKASILANIPSGTPGAVSAADVRGELNGVVDFAVEKLTANRTYFISTTGNDTTGDGSSGAPWATLAKARDYVGRNLFLGGYTVELKLADGTYEGVVANGDGLPHINGGYVWLHGNNANPENVIVRGTTQEAFGAGAGAYFFLSDLKAESTITTPVISSGGTIILGRPAMGGFGGRMLIGRPQGATWSSLISCNNGGYIADGTTDGLEVDTGGTTLGRIATAASAGYVSLWKVRITGNHTILTAGFYAVEDGIIWVGDTTITGGVVTGKRYFTDTGGIIYGKSLEALPGDVAGTQTNRRRETLYADRTYYVRTDGNNANNGLADTSGGAFATLRYALDYLADNIDLNGKTVTIKLNDGTHDGVSFSRLILGSGVIFIKGHATDTTSVVLSGTTSAGLELAGNNALIAYYVGGVKLESSYSYPLSIFGTRVFLGSPDGSTAAVRFGKGANAAWPMIFLNGQGSYCTTWSTGTIIDVDSTTFPVGYFIQAQLGAQVSFGAVAFAATVTFGSAFILATTGAVVSVNTGDDVAASAVGKRYDASFGGVVRRTAGTGGIDNLPGTVAGTWTSGIKNITGILTVTGSIVAAGATFSNSLTMGSGQLIGWSDGGYIFGASGNLSANNLAITDTTVSTSPTTGSLKTAGGLGVAGDLQIGGNHYQNSPYIRTDHSAGIIFTNKAGTDYAPVSGRTFWSGAFAALTSNLIAYECDVTWNNAAVNFRAVKYNVNVTAAGADSRILSLHAGGIVKWQCRPDGSVIWSPPASITPPSNGDMAIQATSDTLATLKLKGSDGTERAGGIQLGGPLTGVTTVSTSAPSGGNDGDVWYQYT